MRPFKVGNYLKAMPAGAREMLTVRKRRLVERGDAFVRQGLFMDVELSKICELEPKQARATMTVLRAAHTAAVIVFRWDTSGRPSVAAVRKEKAARWAKRKKKNG